MLVRYWKAPIRSADLRLSYGPFAANYYDRSSETTQAVVWDGAVVPANDATLARFGKAVEFVKDQYRHCKPILLLRESALAAAALLPATLPDESVDPGLVGMVDADPDDDDTDHLTDQFVLALSKHRVFEQELDPPSV